MRVAAPTLIITVSASIRCTRNEEAMKCGQVRPVATAPLMISLPSAWTIKSSDPQRIATAGQATIIKFEGQSTDNLGSQMGQANEQVHDRLVAQWSHWLAVLPVQACTLRCPASRIWCHR